MEDVKHSRADVVQQEEVEARLQQLIPRGDLCCSNDPLWRRHEMAHITHVYRPGRVVRVAEHTCHPAEKVNQFFFGFFLIFWGFFLLGVFFEFFWFWRGLGVWSFYIFFVGLSKQKLMRKACLILALHTVHAGPPTLAYNNPLSMKTSGSCPDWKRYVQSAGCCSNMERQTCATTVDEVCEDCNGSFDDEETIRTFVERAACGDDYGPPRVTKHVTAADFAILDDHLHEFGVSRSMTDPKCHEDDNFCAKAQMFPYFAKTFFDNEHAREPSAETLAFLSSKTWAKYPSRLPFDATKHSYYDNPDFVTRGGTPCLQMYPLGNCHEYFARSTANYSNAELDEIAEQCAFSCLETRQKLYNQTESSIRYDPPLAQDVGKVRCLSPVANATLPENCDFYGPLIGNFDLLSYAWTVNMKGLNADVPHVYMRSLHPMLQTYISGYIPVLGVKVLRGHRLVKPTDPSQTWFATKSVEGFEGGLILMRIRTNDRFPFGDAARDENGEFVEPPFFDGNWHYFYGSEHQYMLMEVFDSLDPDVGFKDVNVIMYYGEISWNLNFADQTEEYQSFPGQARVYDNGRRGVFCPDTGRKFDNEAVYYMGQNCVIFYGELSDTQAYLQDNSCAKAHQDAMDMKMVEKHGTIAHGDYLEFFQLSAQDLPYYSQPPSPPALMNPPPYPPPVNAPPFPPDDQAHCYIIDPWNTYMSADVRNTVEPWCASCKTRDLTWPDKSPIATVPGNAIPYCNYSSTSPIWSSFPNGTADQVCAGHFIQLGAMESDKYEGDWELDTDAVPIYTVTTELEFTASRSGNLQLDMIISTEDDYDFAVVLVNGDEIAVKSGAMYFKVDTVVQKDDVIKVQYIKDDDWRSYYDVIWVGQPCINELDSPPPAPPSGDWCDCDSQGCIEEDGVNGFCYVSWYGCESAMPSRVYENKKWKPCLHPNPPGAPPAPPALPPMPRLPPSPPGVPPPPMRPPVPFPPPPSPNTPPNPACDCVLDGVNQSDVDPKILDRLTHPFRYFGFHDDYDPEACSTGEGLIALEKIGTGCFYNQFPMIIPGENEEACETCANQLGCRCDPVTGYNCIKSLPDAYQCIVANPDECHEPMYPIEGWPSIMWKFCEPEISPSPPPLPPAPPGLPVPFPTCLNREDEGIMGYYDVSCEFVIPFLAYNWGYSSEDAFCASGIDPLAGELYFKLCPRTCGACAYLDSLGAFDPKSAPLMIAPPPKLDSRLPHDLVNKLDRAMKKVKRKGLPRKHNTLS